MDECFEAALAESRKGLLQQPQILKCAAAQTDAIQPRRFADYFTSRNHHLRHGSMKSRGDLRNRRTAKKILGHTPDRAAQIDLERMTLADFERVASFGLSRDGLQFHCGLALVCGLLADAKNGSNGVKQASARGRLKGLNAARDHRSHEGDLAGRNGFEKRQRQRSGFLAECDIQISEGASPGLAPFRYRPVVGVCVPPE